MESDLILKSCALKILKETTPTLEQSLLLKSPWLISHRLWLPHQTPCPEAPVRGGYGVTLECSGLEVSQQSPFVTQACCQHHGPAETSDPC